MLSTFWKFCNLIISGILYANYVKGWILILSKIVMWPKVIQKGSRLRGMLGQNLIKSSTRHVLLMLSAFDKIEYLYKCETNIYIK